MRTLAALLAAILALEPTLALPAESLGVVAVASPPGPSPELVEITGQLRQALADRNPAVLDARRTRERMQGQLAAASLSELDRGYESARVAYIQGDYEASVKTLRAVIEDLEKLPDGEDSYRQWIRAELRLAKTEQELGHVEVATAALQKVLRTDPELKLDAALAAPRFSVLVEEVRRAVKAQPRQKLTVTSSAAGTRVFVDGRDLGQAPVTATLPRGRHRVSGAIGALRVPPVQVELGEDEQGVALDFSIAEALRPSLGPGLAVPEADRARRVIAAATYMGLDGVVTTSLVERDGVAYLEGTMYDVRKGVITPSGQVRLVNQSLPVGSTTALAEFLLTGKTASSLVSVLGGAPGRSGPDLRWPPPDARGRSARSPTKGWVALGAGIATLGLGGVAVWQGVTARSRYDDASKLLVNGTTLSPGAQARYTQLRSDGDTASRVSTITGAAAGACLITTGILAYLSYKQTGEIGPFRF